SRKRVIVPAPPHHRPTRPATANRPHRRQSIAAEALPFARLAFAEPVSCLGRISITGCWGLVRGPDTVLFSPVRSQGQLEHGGTDAPPPISRATPRGQSRYFDRGHSARGRG